MQDPTSGTESEHVVAPTVLVLCGAHGLLLGLIVLSGSVSNLAGAAAFHALYWGWLIWWPMYWCLGSKASAPRRFFALAGTVAWFVMLPGMFFVTAISLGART